MPSDVWIGAMTLLRGMLDGFVCVSFTFTHFFVFLCLTLCILSSAAAVDEDVEACGCAETDAEEFDKVMNFE